MKSIYLYVDRGINNTHDDGTYPSPERIKWHIKSVDTKNGYQIYSTWSDNQKYSDNAVRDYYLSYYADPNSQKKFLVVTTDKSQAETFYFIKKEDYRKVINNQNKSISMYLVLCGMLVSNETTKVLMVLLI